MACAEQVRKQLIARTVAEGRAGFRKRLGEDLNKHASWAHTLTKPGKGGASPPVVQLKTLHADTQKLEEVMEWSCCS